MSVSRWVFDNLLPNRFQPAIARAYYGRQFRRQLPESDALECRRYFGSGDIVIDIGANLGDYSKVFAESGAIVHAIEPVPETFGYLVSNIRGSGTENVFFYNVAASSESGMLKMTIPKWRGGGRNIYEAHLAADGDILVRACRLDDLFSGVCPTFIKCDVEGHEQQTIKGSLELIKRCHPKWLIEVSSEETVQLMKELGYTSKPATLPNVFFV